MYLLDTNVFSALARPRPPSRLERAFVSHGGEIATSAVVFHELWFGIDRLPLSRRRTELERFMREVVSAVPVLPYGQRAARWHATERARLAREGQPVPFADGQIAATTSVNDAILVTANRKHFDFFEGLRLESWE